MATPIELARLAAAVNLLRPDWPTKSLQTYLENNHTHRPIHDLTVALAWIATDPQTKTPARLSESGPWWTCLNSGATVTSHPVPCEHHGTGYRRADGQLSCCWAARITAAVDTAPTERPKSIPPAEARAAIEAALGTQPPTVANGRPLIDKQRLQAGRQLLAEQREQLNVQPGQQDEKTQK